jgi:hypothetical protein
MRVRGKGRTECKPQRISQHSKFLFIEGDSQESCFTVFENKPYWLMPIILATWKAEIRRIMV